MAPGFATIDTPSGALVSRLHRPGRSRLHVLAWSRGETASDPLSGGDPVDDTEFTYADFHDRVRQAEAEAERAAVASVREAKGAGRGT
jgi:hypothetical protein